MALNNTTTVDGKTVFTWSTSGTVTEYILVEGLTQTEKDFLDAQTADANTASKELGQYLTDNSIVYTATGQDAYTRFGHYVATFDSDSDVETIDSDVATVSDPPTQAEVNEIVDHVNSLQNIVKSIRGVV